MNSCTDKGRCKIGRLLARGGRRIKEGSNWSQNRYSMRLEAIRLWWGSRSQEPLPQFSTLADRLNAMVAVSERDFGQYMSEEDGKVYIFVSLIITQSLNNIFLCYLLSRNTPNTFFYFCHMQTEGRFPALRYCLSLGPHQATAHFSEQYLQRQAFQL